jgi:polar amino acid transport system substrate-binding protein
VDALSVARMMQAGAVDVLILSPATLVGAIQGEPKTEGLAEKLRFEPLEEFTWGDSGAYISRTAMSDADAKVLNALLERASTSGAVWKAFQKYYPTKALVGSIRAR